jgi:hypothetical protein
VVPVLVAEVLGGPDLLDLRALLEDGGDCLTQRALEFRTVGLDQRRFAVVVGGIHAPRLGMRRFVVIRRRCELARALGVLRGTSGALHGRSPHGA